MGTSEYVRDIVFRNLGELQKKLSNEKILIYLCMTIDPSIMNEALFEIEDLIEKD